MAEDLSLSYIFKYPKKWKNLSSYDIVTKYVETALTDKNIFLNYLQHMHAYAPWAIKAFIMGAPNSVYCLKHMFRDEIQFLLPEPNYKYGSQNILQFLNDIDKLYANQSVLNPNYRKQLIFKAAEVLSNDDYKVFSLVINNGFNPKIYEYIEEFYNEKNLPESIYKFFLFSLKKNELTTVPDNLFNNDTNSAYMYFPNGELQYYLLFNNVCIKLNANFEKDTKNKDNEQITNKFKVNISNKEIPVVLIIDDSGVIGSISYKGLSFYKQPVNVSEHAFSIKICKGLKSAFIIDTSSNTRGGYKIAGLIGYDAGTIKNEAKQISSFSVNVLPYFGYTASIITCQEKDSENTFFVFALSEQANKIGKNLKTIKLASLIGRYFYVG